MALGVQGSKAKKRGLSKEQIPVLVVEDGRGNHFDQVLESVDQSTIGVILPQLLSDESLLCTDGAHVYSSVAKDYKIPHESVRFAKHGYVKERVFHVQHVNTYDSRLKTWMTRFKGVATKLTQLPWLGDECLSELETSCLQSGSSQWLWGKFNTNRGQILVKIHC
ncbi:IS1595 family transposase [Desulfovibrio inopinatus]|uniref:IS1595 family transposase n=1 Tax=Desulfovibrio inopinatus TaxID=102109 RepID=UPI00041AC69A